MSARFGCAGLTACGVALAATIFGADVLRAHELGGTRVSVSFGVDRTDRIEIETDADALLEKLENARGHAPEGDSSEPPASRLRALDDIFRTRVKVSFDGVDALPSIDHVVDAPDEAGNPPGAKILLVGGLPDRVQYMTWAYGWTFASYALTVERGATDVSTTEWLEGGAASRDIAVAVPQAPRSRFSMALEYLRLGFTHILPKGLDHVLFVLGIFLLTRRLRPVLLQVTAFTVAHSITLGLSMYGAVRMPSAIVEPLIAASIVYVAAENLFLSELRRRRLALVFAFGLLHGLGFAGVLAELGLPPGHFATALVAFNLGVEAGQLAVIGAAFLAVGWTWGRRAWYRQRIVLPASLAIAGIAAYWTVERIAL
jgi:hypothetical protein